jgi:hypothetical protein
MEDERRAVLERVARGELSPAEAASLLEGLESRPGAGPAGADEERDWASDWSRDPAWSPPDAPPVAGPEGRATRIRIVRTIGTADIIGDPSVSEAVAEGPHRANREGDTLVIVGQDDGFDMPGFFFGGPGRHRGQAMRRQHRMGRGDFSPLRIRVNPDLPLEIEAQAGRVRVRGVHGPIQGNIQAGGLDIVDFRSPIDLTVQAGSVSARGRLDGGQSRVRCDAGSVRFRLERGSSVRVSARNTLGKVLFDNGNPYEPWVIGAGDGTLDIDTTMGAVRVSAE